MLSISEFLQTTTLSEPETSLEEGFSLNPRQIEANKLLGGKARHIMLYGGSRSGKTFLICRAIAIRALKRQSSHVILRFRFNALKGSIIMDTFPKMMRLCFPEVSYKLNRSDWYFEMPNKSVIWLGGLDDKDRTEKILGTEHSGIFLNECSQITYDARNKAVTRLAQNVGLPLRMWYDQNPPSIGHWTYRLFEKHIEPRSGKEVNPEMYVSMQINPDQNRFVTDEYREELAALSERDRIRFLKGQYQSQVDNALWNLDMIRRERPPDNDMERDNLISRMHRIVVAVDPSGCEGIEDFRSDEIGIVVCGRDRSGMGYVLQDLSGRYSPEGWGSAAVKAYDDWQADTIVAERNFGGAMVESTIRATTLRESRPSVPVRVVTASRGKTVRAEPVSALYERTPVREPRIVHVGAFPDMEEQMLSFSTGGYQGARSPDRADAMVWGMTELMLDGKGPMVINKAALDAARQHGLRNQSLSRMRLA